MIALAIFANVIQCAKSSANSDDLRDFFTAVGMDVNPQDLLEDTTWDSDAESGYSSQLSESTSSDSSRASLSTSGKGDFTRRDGKFKILEKALGYLNDTK